MRLEVDLVIGNVEIVGRKKLFEPITGPIGNNSHRYHKEQSNPKIFVIH